MNSHPPLVAVISAVAAAIPPARAAFDALLPDATVWNVVDDRLVDDADGEITPRLAARMRRLIDHVVVEGADAVLLSCSMYAGVAHRVDADVLIPVHGPDDGLFGAVAAGGFHRIALVSPAADPLADSLARMRMVVGSDVTVVGVVADGAPAAARAADVDALVDAVVSAVSRVSPKPDAVVLGQYSLAPAAAGVQASLGLPTLSAPEHAVRRLQTLVTRDAS
ncbi:hypothetical protein ASD37_19150 [Mycobacterium sp. Root135]|uniref:hypothetical protein n=1 Tax=Mycobacterium sp. Root135 TaxID=1736457 RepID=UPI0006FE95D5|nr:hypothetical protein [Mycobacterium sp. Root135]KQY06396.1 hypothetical protein ASD37_19150 [Mycobacterium sp. Root135]